MDGRRITARREKGWNVAVTVGECDWGGGHREGGKARRGCWTARPFGDAAAYSTPARPRMLGVPRDEQGERHILRMRNMFFAFSQGALEFRLGEKRTAQRSVPSAPR